MHPDDVGMSLPTGRLSGRLLIASPMLEDENFRRTVILVLDHGDDGALGLVVNRPMEVDVSSVLPAWQPYTTAPGRLFRGGPVQLDSALGLVALPGNGGEPLGIRLLIGSIGLVDLDAPPEVIASGLAGLRIFAGYAGWGAAQLDGEIEEGSWYVVPGETWDAFRTDTTELWREVLRRQPGEMAWHSTRPADPELN